MGGNATGQRPKKATGVSEPSASSTQNTMHASTHHTQHPTHQGPGNPYRLVAECCRAPCGDGGII